MELKADIGSESSTRGAKRKLVAVFEKDLTALPNPDPNLHPNPDPDPQDSVGRDSLNALFDRLTNPNPMAFIQALTLPLTLSMSRY